MRKRVLSGCGAVSDLYSVIEATCSLQKVAIWDGEAERGIGDVSNDSD